MSESETVSPIEPFKYHSGFGSHIESEALPDVLPVGQNSPQVCAYGLYAEQLSGSAFTCPRNKNVRSWLYRIRPSVQTLSNFQSIPSNQLASISMNDLLVEPNPLRWDPAPLPSNSAELNVDFLHGLTLVCGNGDPSLKQGLCIYTYIATQSMQSSAFYNSDGDFLIVPQLGALIVLTEFGRLRVEPCEILVIPRGVKYAVQLEELNGICQPIRGYVLEIFQGHFELPNLGPIGANGLANPRDFLIPTAWFEDVDNSVDNSYKFLIINKYCGQFFQVELNHSPFDVVGWHG